MTRKPPAFVGLAKIAAYLLLAVWLVHILTAGLDEIAQTPPPGEIMNIRPSAPGAPATVYEKHAEDCWRGSEKPLADFPGHVIWQHPDGRTVYSKALVGPALETLFGDGDLPGQAIAFCL